MTLGFLFLLFLVETGDVLTENIVVGFLVLRFLLTFAHERERFFSALVQCNDLECSVGIDGYEVCSDVFVSGVGYLAFEHIVFEVVVCGVGGFESDFFGGHSLDALDVGVYLEVYAAFELGALSGELLGVERNVLKPCGGCAYRHEVGHPACAAQRTPAGTYAPDASRFLTRSDLFHFDAHLECLGEHFYELAEVDAFVGDIVEYGFVAVALVLHVSDFHVEVEVLGYFASPYHSVVLARLGFIVLVNVAGLGFAEHSFEFGALFHARFFHLQGYKLTGEGHLSYVMSG